MQNYGKLERKLRTKVKVLRYLTETKDKGLIFTTTDGIEMIEKM